MPELASSEAIIVRAAIGWLELNVPPEALLELQQLPEATQDYPDVLEVKWLALAALTDWDRALEVTGKLVRLAPERAHSWLNHAYATRRASSGGLQQAFEILSSAASKFNDEPTIPYNLACYTCQLQRDPAEVMHWFKEALRIGEPKKLIEMALADPDLEPVRDIIRKTNTKPAT